MYKKNKKIKELNPEILNGDQNGEPICVVDSDFANDPDTAKSVGGMIVSLAGTAVSWRSKLLRMVATSTCHAEYMAAYEVIRVIVWLRMLLEEIGFNLAKPSVRDEDNAAAKATAESIGISNANKHIRVKFHWVRECIRDGLVKMRTVESAKNAADGLTKAAVQDSILVLKNISRLREIGKDMESDEHYDQGG